MGCYPAGPTGPLRFTPAVKVRTPAQPPAVPALMVDASPSTVPDLLNLPVPALASG